jgi:hypothetical protein
MGGWPARLSVLRFLDPSIFSRLYCLCPLKTDNRQLTSGDSDTLYPARINMRSMKITIRLTIISLMQQRLPSSPTCFRCSQKIEKVNFHHRATEIRPWFRTLDHALLPPLPCCGRSPDRAIRPTAGLHMRFPHFPSGNRRKSPKRLLPKDLRSRNSQTSTKKIEKGSTAFDLGLWTLDLGPWTLDLGPWTLDLGPWTLDLGLWTLDFGPWTLDFGLWTLDLGPWTAPGPRRPA